MTRGWNGNDFDMKSRTLQAVNDPRSWNSQIANQGPIELFFFEFVASGEAEHRGRIGQIGADIGCPLRFQVLLPPAIIRKVAPVC